MKKMVRNALVIGIILTVAALGSTHEALSQTDSKRSGAPVESVSASSPKPSSDNPETRYGYLSEAKGVVPDSKCAECHPRQVRLMHKHLTGVGKAKTHELTQGMINLAVDCRPDGKGSFTCRPIPEAKCFNCHAVSVSAETLSLIDLAAMKAQKRENEILGHGCLTCHPPRGTRDHHLTGNIQAITIRASQGFMKGCGGCHGEGLAGITGGGSPHDWLSRHLESQQQTDKGVGQ